MKSALKYSLVLLALGLAVVALRQHFAELPSLMRIVDWIPLGIALVGLLIYQFWNASVWSEVLGVMGLSCRRLDSARVWLEAESLKWLPGTIWCYGSRVVTAQKLGVNKKQASSSIVLELILTNIAWAILGGTIVFSGKVMIVVGPWLDQGMTFLADRWWVFVLSVMVAFPCMIFLYRTIIRSKRFKQLLDIGKISYTKCLRTVCHYVLLCIWNATMMWVVFGAIPSLDIPYFTVLGVAGVAWLVGFWSIGIPGGIGVREAVIVLFLSQYASVELSLLAAVLWRGLQMLAEIGALLVSLSIGANQHFKCKEGERGNV